jgi:DTW domain-containing protein YfiP
MCARCRRPVSVCYCAALPRLETRTRVVILQHPRERDMPIGTARMASLCLPSASLHVGIRWEADSAVLRDALGDPARPPILLYPGPDATDILRDPPPGPVTLVVVDGTWSQARSVVRDNPVLRALPRYAFAAPVKSEYRIRKEPDDEYVSTIEALMHVLGALEGDPARFRALLAPLRAMVEIHLEHREASPRARYRQRISRPPSARLPPAIFERRGDLVCLVGEANAWPYRDPAAHQPDELVHLVAARLATGETFEGVCVPQGPLSTSTPHHTRLDEATLRAGMPRAELLAAFARFLRPTDILCTWGHYGANLVTAGGGALPDTRIDLRVAAQRLTQRKAGALEDYAASLGPLGAPQAAGRAGERLAMLGQIVASWQALPTQ